MSKDRPEKTKYRVVVDEGKCLGRRDKIFLSGKS